MRRTLLALVALAVPAVSQAKPPTPGLAKPPSQAKVRANAKAKPKRKSNPADLPTLTNASSPTEKSVIRTKCELVPGSAPRRATCTTTQAIVVGPPDTAAIAKDVSLWKSFAKADLLKVMKELCTTEYLGQWDKASARAEQDFAVKLKSACKQKDRAAFIDAMAWHAENVDAHACKFEVLMFDPIEFVQKNADTWVATTSGLCGATTTITLWRSPGDLDIFWNYKQVRTFPPNAAEHSEQCSGAADYTAEWRWDQVQLPVRELGCEFMR